MFAINQTVVCVDDALRPETAEEIIKDVPNFVKKGNKYTIRSIEDYDFLVGIRVEEVVNPAIYFKLIDRKIEPCFATWRFRALVEDEVSVASEVFSSVV